jgi:YfiH family protein
MITDSPEVGLGVVVADCVPVLLYDTRRHALGLAHAGWRGTVGLIARETLQAMRAAFGSDPADVAAGIGPSIGPCCYEVGDEVIEAWRAAGVANANHAVVSRHTRYHFDLWTANRLVLVECGVPRRRIEDSALCTRCHRDRLFSYRAAREGLARGGRMMFVAQLGAAR